jgi:hypothetical protein
MVIDRSNSPGSSAMIRGPITNSRSGIRRSVPSGDHTSATPSSAVTAASTPPAGNAEHTLPPTVAVRQILCEASNARQPCANSAVPGHSGRSTAVPSSRPGAAPANSVKVQVAAISSPSGVSDNAVQPSAVMSTNRSNPSCGSENK